jgi:hypothetical protein
MVMTSRRTIILVPMSFEVVVFVIAAVSHPHLNREFFTATSQILPILLLAALIDKKLLTAERSVAALLLLGSFVMGEGFALGIVGNRSAVITNPIYFGIVVASLAGLAVLILLTSLPGQDHVPAAAGAAEGTDSTG